MITLAAPCKCIAISAASDDVPTVKFDGCDGQVVPCEPLDERNHIQEVSAF